MTKVKNSNSTKKAKPKVNRPGVHSKTKNGKSKTAKHYKKNYRGQGR